MESSNLPRREHIRLRNYDYRTPGDYFITLCLKDRSALFGDVVENSFLPNAIGSMILDIWNTTSRQFSHVEPYAVMVMPDHLH